MGAAIFCDIQEPSGDQSDILSTATEAGEAPATDTALASREPNFLTRVALPLLEHTDHQGAASALSVCSLVVSALHSGHSFHRSEDSQPECLMPSLMFPPGRSRQDRKDRLGSPWVHLRSWSAEASRKRACCLPGFHVALLGSPEAHTVPWPVGPAALSTSLRGDSGAVTQAEGDARGPRGPGAAQGPESHVLSEFPLLTMDKFSKDIESSDNEFYFENKEKSEKCNSDESEFSEDASGDDEQIAGPVELQKGKSPLLCPKIWLKVLTVNSDIEFIKAKRRRTIVYSINVGPQVPSGCATPIDFFQLFFTETLIKNITDETNEYARHKISQKELSQRSTWNNWKDVTIEEMKAFLAVILNMGVLNHPNLQSYWSMDFESHIPLFSICFQKRKVLANILDVTLEKRPKVK
ncbi:hypothetical protein QTO34_010745 [Cnephaeus nilssonii]|uniref:PiggyBac transposable element-derived protein domain-containing protein n=1 Tax=Cnephaeus nilssonii TaxID=3371016 RepID=A0AA40LF45_CNENI|nr:hypothetical protein QTO34_010745 [Eptesicus nilssonii]